MLKTITVVITFLYIICADVCAQQPVLDIDTSAINTYVADSFGQDFDYDTVLEYIQAGDVRHAVVYLKNAVINYFKESYIYHNNIMSTIIAICLFTCIITILKSGGQDTLCEIMLVCALSSVMTNVYFNAYKTALSVISGITGFMNVSLPVYFGIVASVTNKLPLSVYGVFTWFILVFQWMSSNIVLPAISVITVCGMVDKLYGSFRLSGIKKLITNSIHWLLGLYTTFFVAVLKLTQIAAYGTDKVFMSGLKYTVSHAIPVVGGFISEAAGAVITCTLILHNSVGLASVVVLVAVTIVPFITMFLLSAMIKLISAALSVICENTVTDVLFAFGESICELSIVLLCACVTFVIGIGIQLTTLR